MRALSLAVVVGFVAACQGCNCGVKPLVHTTCDFEVTPTGSPGIAFPDTEVGHSSVRSWRLKNTSKGVSLDKLTVTFEARNGANYSTDIPPTLRIPVGQEQTFVITFTPTAATTLASNFTVSHPNVGPAQCPSVQVTVEGKGFVPQEVDAGPEDGGEHDAGFGDAGPFVDGGTVEPPDGGITLPVNGQWFAYGAFEDARARFAAVQAQDGTGDIIAVGGYGEDGAPLDSIERFNPAKGISRVIGHMAVARAEPALATLADGRIVIMGGRNAAVGGVALRTVEILDPVHGDTLVCAETAGACGVNDQATAALPTGRIGAFASTMANGTIAFVLGRTLDGSGNEVPADGGETLTFNPTIAAGNLGNASLLTGRTGDVRVLNTNTNDGRFLVVGGQTLAGVAGDVFLVDQTGASALPSLAHPRTLAGATLLSTGDLLVAGGAAATGAPENHVEKIAHAFGGGTATLSAVTLDLPPRIGGSLVAIASDFVLWAGGTSTRTDVLNANQSVTPLQTADVVVPFGATSFARLSPDNDLAQGRLDHVAMPYASSGQGGTIDTVLFMGGVNTSPRRTPHPHIERYVATLNKFVTYGLMGAGTALEAGVVTNSGAALVSAGGIDPHTGSTSSTVRAFDAQAGAYVDDGTLREPRRDHTLTRIADNPANALLVAGGRDENGVVLDSLSIYDSVNEVDHILPVALSTPRANHTATRLADNSGLGVGAVLLCGGIGANGEALDTCEIFVPPDNPLDEATYNTAHVLPVLQRLQTGRIGHTATLLDTGEVLIVGGGDVGSDLVAGDLFVPATTSLRATAGTPSHARTGHAAIFIGGGDVLLVGGNVSDGNVIGPTKTAEIYSRGNDAFTPIASEMLEERANPAVFLLAGGDVLVAGGTRTNNVDPTVPTKSDKTSELFVAATQSFENLPNVPLSYGRSDVLFVDVFGRAIVYGGDHRDGILGIGDERHTPITFVDFLQDPGTAINP